MRALSIDRCLGWPSCFACAINRGFFAADGQTALHVQSIVASLTRMAKSALRARSIVGLLPRMAEVWLCDPRRLLADPRFACVILGLFRKSSDPRFAQQNPRMVQIRTLRIMYSLA